jgi:hypothetical protein
MQYTLVRLFICIGFCLIVFTSSAQPGPPPDPDVPITGIEILLALGGFLGVRKFIGSKKKNN